jgi:hypothetical protein
MESGNLETFPKLKTQTADEAQGAAGATLVEQEPNKYSSGCVPVGDLQEIGKGRLSPTEAEESRRRLVMMTQGSVLRSVSDKGEHHLDSTLKVSMHRKRQRSTVL